MTAGVQEVIVAVAAVAAGSVVLWRVVRALRPSAKSEPGCDNCATGDLAASERDRRVKTNTP
jgi:hypothetical protein